MRSIDRALNDLAQQLRIYCVSLRKSMIGFLNPKGSESGFSVSLLDRSIQDLSDHGASKEPKNPLSRVEEISSIISLEIIVKVFA